MGTYYLTARAWYQDVDGKWLATKLGQRVAFEVSGEIQFAPPTPAPLEINSNRVTANWTGGGDIVEIFVYRITIVTEQKVAGKKVWRANSMTFDGLDSGSYYLAARTWYRNSDEVWVHSSFSAKAFFEIGQPD